MLILGIETSCDETAAAVLEVHPVKLSLRDTGFTGFNRVKVLSNVVSSQIKIHAPFGGVVPSLAAREHVKNLRPVLNSALQTTHYSLPTIDLIAVTAGPGLISSLLVGTAFAKTLAWKYKKPIVGVNHIEGHLLSNWLPESNKLSAISHKLSPAMCLVVSGGHTQLILMRDFGKYKLIGETVDDAAGEAFDKIARILELGYPGGPAISAEAEKEESRIMNQESRIKLPRPMLNSKDFNFSFAGLKTAVLYQTRELLKKHSLEEIKSAMAHEAQEAIVDVLTQKTISAAKKYKAKSIMLSGGVSANKRLREKLSQETEKMRIPFFKPELEYTGDNAAMIALAGYFQAMRDKRQAENWKKVQANANWELV
ncbi:MAG: tRNA (adenosine(37)-N6)-threonylcarbamoyltransferase complex transferase subunit TsaD [Minisyncoccia bacterium]|jgi:N6-L-threonylcarbamoyladenine synthase